MADAYHCRILAHAKHRFAEALRECPFVAPEITVLRNVDSQPYTRDNIVQGLLDHFDHTVLFADSVRNAIADLEAEEGEGVTVVDVGSKGFLTKCVEDIEQATPPRVPLVKMTVDS